MDLAVPIPKKNKSIIRCMNIHFDYELIECDYHCGKCNAITNVRKYYIINNLIFNRSRKN